MKKRILALIICMISCFMLTGCRDLSEFLLGESATNRIFGEEEEVVEWREVSTREELKGGGNIKLTADIDFGYEMIEGISCTRIDGQGHTISNCIVSGGAFFDDTSGEEISNLIFDNITVEVTEKRAAAIVKREGDSCIDNVHVINSKVTCTQNSAKESSEAYIDGCYVGGIYGGGKIPPYVHGSGPNAGVTVEASAVVSISNSSVKNVTIEAIGYEGGVKSIYVGGIAGAATTVTNCVVESCDISAQSKGVSAHPYVGGIVGFTDETIKNSGSINNKIYAEARYYKKNVLGLGYETSEAYAGGLLGRATGEEANGVRDHDPAKKVIETCYAENNSITIKSSGKVRAGGLCGVAYMVAVRECYAANNEITALGGIADDASPDVRSLGGLIGYAGTSTVSSCFALGNTLKEETLPQLEKGSLAGGLIGDASEAVVTYCATRDNQLTALTADEFCALELGDKKYNCFISGQDYKNVNNCELVDDSFWLSEKELKEKLNLIGTYWRFGAEYPSLKWDNE